MTPAASARETSCWPGIRSNLDSRGCPQSTTGKDPLHGSSGSAGCYPCHQNSARLSSVGLGDGEQMKRGLPGTQIWSLCCQRSCTPLSQKQVHSDFLMSTSRRDFFGNLLPPGGLKKEIRPMSRPAKRSTRLKPGYLPLQGGDRSAGVSQFGLVAEDVEEVNPDLVVRDKGGKSTPCATTP